MDDEDGSKLIARLTSSYHILEQEAERSARWFNETRFDVVCLKKVFTRVRILDRVEFAYEGMEIGYSKFAQRYCEGSQHEMSRPFVSTMGALASTGASVRRIEIAKGKGYGAISVGRLESLAPSLKAFDGLFEGLQVLRLKLRDWRMPDEGFQLESGRLPFSVRFLAKCRNVRVLDLSFYSTLEDDAFGELVRACRFEKLDSVTLELFRVRLVSDLFQFFEPSEGCLEEVSLKSIMLDEHDLNESGQDVWKQIFHGFADEKRKFEKLQVFHAERLLYESPLGARRVFLKREGLKILGLRIEGEHLKAKLRDVDRERCKIAVPKAVDTKTKKAVIEVKAGQVFDGLWYRCDRGSGACGGQGEGDYKDAVFHLREGATLRNVIIGKNQAEGVHCNGHCTPEFVWWEDVCEDALYIKNDKAGSQTWVIGGGAYHGSDKIIQHNGCGTVNIINFYVEDYGKLYRSCGNCSKQRKRNIYIKSVTAKNEGELVGINSNYKDTATLKNVCADAKTKCQMYIGCAGGCEPKKAGTCSG
ncbi:hypothetical protein SLS61_004889 [Didymella pomorum]